MRRFERAILGAVSRERAAARIAYFLLAILAVEILLTFVSIWQDWATVAEAKELAAVLITPVVALVGAATGFYFRDSPNDTE